MHRRDTRKTAIHRPLRENRHVAALLSALWPGLGHLGLGARRTALTLALPPLALVVLGLLVLAGPGRVGALASLLDPSILAALLILQLAFLAWRLAAVGDALRRGRGALRGKGLGLTTLALAFVLVPSAYGAYITEVAREASLDVFAPASEVWQPSVTHPYERDEDFAPAATSSPGPTLSPAPDLGRYTVLLIGVDAGPGRMTFLTDTMIVASLDPVAGSVSMLSIPRDLVDVPLPDGRVFRGKINTLVAYANHNLRKFPGATSGQSVLAAALQELLRVKIDGWAQVNLPGFVAVIDAIGGVDVTVRDGFCDPRYREYGFNGFAIGEGRWHLDGEAALAYARVRKAAGESDFTRAARQAQVIVAARDRIVAGGFLADPAKFIRSMGKLVSTSIDPADLSKYAEPASTITRDLIFQKVMASPFVRHVSGDPRGWILVPNLERIRELAAQAFPQAGTLPEGVEAMPEEDDGPAKKRLPAVNCYVPKPPPAPTPTATPQPEPTDQPDPTAPPATDPPATDPPATTPPATDPPATVAPETEKPGGGQSGSSEG